MPLTKNDANTLRNSGFLLREVDHIAENLDETRQIIDLNLPAWQMALAKRRKYIDKELKRLSLKGYNREEAMDIIFRKIEARYIQNDKLTPWDFLRAEYSKIIDGKKVDYIENARKRARRKTGGLTRV